VVSALPSRLARARFPLANLLSIASVLIMVRAVVVATWCGVCALLPGCTHAACSRARHVPCGALCAPQRSHHPLPVSWSPRCGAPLALPHVAAGGAQQRHHRGVGLLGPEAPVQRVDWRGAAPVHELRRPGRRLGEPC
jgi:hypothetical protein